MPLLHHSAARGAAALLALSLLGCPVGNVGDVDGGRTDGGSSEPVPTAPPLDAGATIAAPTVDPLAEDGATLPWPAAPALGAVQYVANRDSVLLVLPEFAGVRDYRAFRVPAGVSVREVGGGEQVDGTTIHCAGYRQRNDGWSGTRELLRVLEVTELSEPSTLVIEALDRACPFSGPIAPQHRDITVTIDEVPPVDRVTWSIFTPAEVRARFGSLVLNGHGKGPTLASQGDTAPPRVLARTAVRVTPSGRGTPRTAEFFEDFDGTSGPLALVGDVDGFGRAYSDGRHFSNAKWDAYIYNDEEDSAQLNVERGLLHVTMTDWGQDVFGSAVLVPRQPAALSSTDYLHLTWEVASNATARRYWWVGLCGAGQAGRTFDGAGHFAGNLVQTPFFYEPDGRNVSIEGWNCLQFFPRDGSPFPLEPDDKRTQSDLRVMINLPDAGVRDSVVNLSPAQYPEYAARPSWFRQQNANGTLGPGVLDDQLLISPRTRFDAWVRRDRLVLYVNGEQRLCNDFPAHALTMAEAAVAWGQVLYHTAAERIEFDQDFNLRTGQRYYLENAPYVDEREWDNLGFEAGVAAPANFDPAACYVAP